MSRLEDFATAVHAQLDDATVERVMYRRREHRHSQRRRIHWYTATSGLEGPRQSGGREESTNRTPTAWERQERVVALIFAENFDTLDTLLDNLIVAVDRTYPNGSALRDATYSFDWDNVNQRNPTAELEFMVKWPVADEIKGLTTITDEELTCDFE